MQKLRVESSKCCFRDAKDAGVMKVQVTLCPDGCCRCRACDDPRYDRLAGAVQRRDHLTALPRHTGPHWRSGRAEPGTDVATRKTANPAPWSPRLFGSIAAAPGPPDLTALAPSGVRASSQHCCSLLLPLPASRRGIASGIDRRRAGAPAHCAASRGLRATHPRRRPRGRRGERRSRARRLGRGTRTSEEPEPLRQLPR